MGTLFKGPDPTKVGRMSEYIRRAADEFSAIPMGSGPTYLFVTKTSARFAELVSDHGVRLRSGHDDPQKVDVLVTCSSPEETCNLAIRWLVQGVS